MFEDLGDRTQAATPRRREQFRRAGRVARSADLTAAIVMIVSLIMLGACGARIVTTMQTMIKEGLSSSITSLDVSSLGKGSHLGCLLVLMPLLVVAMGVGAAASVAQIGLPMSF